MAVSNPLSMTERPLADRIGFAHVAGKYHLTDKDFLTEGADLITRIGSRVIKLWFTQNPSRAYPFNSEWGTYGTLIEVAEAPYFKRVFSGPFTTIILETWALGLPRSYWLEEVTPEQAAEETRQFREFTKYLLTTYAGSGKTFILQIWEGDWAARGQSRDPEIPPTRKALDGMISWLNARQDGVDQAREEMGDMGVNVFHAAEVNLVAKAMEGKPSVTNDVLPHTHCDLYSYSSWDTHHDPEKFKAALDHIAEKAPRSKHFAGRNVYLGEYGCPENKFGSEKALEVVRNATQIALEWGAPWLAFWEVYDNEAIEGKSDEPGDCPGFWLLKPSGAKAVFWDFFEGLLKAPR